MLAKEDLLAQYEKCSDEELFRMYADLADYSEAAQDALKKLIEERGGLNQLLERHQQQLQTQKEKERIRQETARLFVNDANLDFLKNLITSDRITPQETHQIIEQKFSELKSEHEDKQIRPRTVFGSLIGGIAGSVAGGVLWGLQMIQMHRMFFIFIAALVLISYGLIRLFTRQSKSNTMVLLATIFSVIGALFIGQLLFSIFG